MPPYLQRSYNWTSISLRRLPQDNPEADQSRIIAASAGSEACPNTVTNSKPHASDWQRWAAKVLTSSSRNHFHSQINDSLDRSAFCCCLPDKTFFTMPLLDNNLQANASNCIDTPLSRKQSIFTFSVLRKVPQNGELKNIKRAINLTLNRCHRNAECPKFHAMFDSQRMVQFGLI